MTPPGRYHALKRRSSLPIWASLGWRVAAVLGLLGIAIGVHWIDREGLRDNYDGAISFLDVIYFTMISITTTGYGDIAPVTPQARMFDALIVTPIRVFGHDTDHIAFSGGGIVALLDLPDPRPLAKQLALETAVDTPAKAMFGKEVRSEEVRDQASGKALIDSAVLNVSNVSSHPGKTLAGCSYSLDLAEDDAEGETGDEAPPPAPAVQPG